MLFRSQTGAVNITASSLGAVPSGRTINGKALTEDITLSASDVGAAPSAHTSTEASNTVLGHVKIGTGLNIINGIVSIGDVDGGTF